MLLPFPNSALDYAADYIITGSAAIKTRRMISQTDFFSMLPVELDAADSV
jgi:hypothetical protein